MPFFFNKCSYDTGLISVSSWGVQVPYSDESSPDLLPKVQLKRAGAGGSILIDEDDGSGKKTKRKGRGAAVTVLGPGDMPAPSQSDAAMDEDTEDALGEICIPHNRLRASDSTPLPANQLCVAFDIFLKRLAHTCSVPTPTGDRVASMNLSEAKKRDADARLRLKTKAPQAGSLAALLVQALQSDDSALLTQCLVVREEKVTPSPRCPTLRSCCTMTIPLMPCLKDSHSHSALPHHDATIIW